MTVEVPLPTITWRGLPEGPAGMDGGKAGALAVGLKTVTPEYSRAQRTRPPRGTCTVNSPRAKVVGLLASPQASVVTPPRTISLKATWRVCAEAATGAPSSESIERAAKRRGEGEVGFTVHL